MYAISFRGLESFSGFARMYPRLNSTFPPLVTAAQVTPHFSIPLYIRFSSSHHSSSLFIVMPTMAKVLRSLLSSKPRSFNCSLNHSIASKSNASDPLEGIANSSHY